MSERSDTPGPMSTLPEGSGGPTLAPVPCADPLADLARVEAAWVFAYGSLIWNPDFDFTERHRVRVYGYHRAFCISSTRYRGSPDAPGVVLGLDRGGSCQGVVYRMAPGQEPEIVEALYQREMFNRVYEPKLLPVGLGDGRVVRAVTFIARREHPSYLRVSRAEILRRLSSCRGGRGLNRDYAVNTWLALRDWGIEDAGLAGIVRDLEKHAGSDPPDKLPGTPGP